MHTDALSQVAQYVCQTRFGVFQVYVHSGGGMVLTSE